jgi:hypothetical protein
MASIAFHMTSTGSSLPTAWLAPPPGLLHSDHATRIAPVPIAISVTLTIIVGVFVVFLFTRGNKDVFLEDKIIATQKGNDEPRAAPRDGSPNIGLPYNVHVPERFRAPSESTIPKFHLPQPAQGLSTHQFLASIACTTSLSRPLGMANQRTKTRHPPGSQQHLATHAQHIHSADLSPIWE